MKTKSCGVQVASFSVKCDDPPSVNSKPRFSHAAIKRGKGTTGTNLTRKKRKSSWISTSSDLSLGHRSGIVANILSISSRSSVGSEQRLQRLEDGRNRNFIWRTSSVGGSAESMFLISFCMNGGRQTARCAFKDVRRGNGPKRSAMELQLPESVKDSKSLNHAVYRKNEDSSSTVSIWPRSFM